LRWFKPDTGFGVSAIHRFLKFSYKERPQMASDTSTVVGVFNDYSTAEQAARELIDNGIPRESVHIQSANRTAAAGRSDYQAHNDEGGIKGFFHRMFGGENESGRYSQAVESGRSVVIVDASEAQADRAVALLNQYGAIDIDDDADKAAYTGTAGARAGTARDLPGEPAARDLPAEPAIPVVDEEIKVGKRSVQRGGVRVYSQVIDRPVEEQVILRDEHVRVERRPVDRPITEAELSGLRDQSFEVTESVEEPVIEKHARVTEEVVLGKETTEKTQTVRDTVRRTDVKVERFGDTGSADYETDFRNDWQRNYAGQGGEYSAYAPAYDYGYRFASDPRYGGRSWSEVEPQLRSSYERDNPGGAWDRVKNAVRYGWDKVTGRP
jgi:uncharacterized protein (TIGR02271 family)